MENIKHISNKPLSEKDIIEKFDVDTARRMIDSLKHRHWNAQQKDPEGNPVLLDMFGTVAWLKLKHPILEYEDILKEIFQDFVPPAVEEVQKETQSGLMAILFNTDKHIDRLEHNSNYLKNVDKTNMELIEQIQKRDIDRFVYAELWDLFNTNTRSQTERGTQQYNSMTEADSFKVWMEHELWTIKKLEEIFGKVEVAYLQGNHDPDKQTRMAQALNLYFSNNPNVTIDDRDILRKYITHWKNVVGLQHWHTVPRNRALETFALEHPLRTYNYLIQWHIHHEKSKQFGKLLAQSIGSPAKPSKRERDNGYINKSKAIAMIFDEKKGRIVTLES